MMSGYWSKWSWEKAVSASLPAKQLARKGHDNSKKRMSNKPRLCNYDYTSNKVNIQKKNKTNHVTLTPNPSSTKTKKYPKKVVRFCCPPWIIQRTNGKKKQCRYAIFIPINRITVFLIVLRNQNKQWITTVIVTTVSSLEQARNKKKNVIISLEILSTVQNIMWLTIFMRFLLF